MQKISSYLYPNKINVIVDDPLFSVRWKIVYQNRIKIYQGVDNVLTIDVKNADQKRIDITEMTLEMSIMDVNGIGIVTVPITPSEKEGLATANISSTSLENLSPQFLMFSIYRINEDLTRTILYADSQYGGKGMMELIGSVIPTRVPPRFITTWLDITSDSISAPWTTTWYSDAVEIRQPNYVNDEIDDKIDFEFLFKELEGIVNVQFTKETVISANISWETIDTFSVDTTVSSLIKTYSNLLENYNRRWNWARVTYIRAKDNEGSIDKVIIRL